MTTFMGLSLPTVSSTIGPDWAVSLNAALTEVDSHDHTSGKGTRVPTAGININAALDFGEYAITDLGKATFTNLSVLDSDNSTIYVKDGDWYMNDGSGNQVRITSGGALNVGSVGGIGGDYGSTAATAFYTDASLTYFFQDSASAAAKIDVGAIAASGTVVLSSTLSAGASTLTSLSVTGAATVGTTLGVSGASTLAALTTSGTLTANGATVLNGTTTLAGATTISGTPTISGDANFTGNTTGRGIIPVGGVIALMANLTGITDVTATTAADANGFVVCGGQTISDGTSPMDGVTIPNINNSVFLMGHSTAGTTGGNNTLNLSHSHTVNSHTHTISTHSHSEGTLLARLGQENTGSGQIAWETGGISPFSANRRGGAVGTYSTTSVTAYGGGVNVTGVTGGTTSTEQSGATSPGTNSQLSSSQDIRPSYISAKYIIRIR